MEGTNCRQAVGHAGWVEEEGDRNHADVLHKCAGLGLASRAWRKSRIWSIPAAQAWYGAARPAICASEWPRTLPFPPYLNPHLALSMRAELILLAVLELRFESRTRPAAYFLPKQTEVRGLIPNPLIQSLGPTPLFWDGIAANEIA